MFKFAVVLFAVIACAAAKPGVALGHHAAIGGVYGGLGLGLAAAPLAYAAPAVHTVAAPIAHAYAAPVAHAYAAPIAHAYAAPLAYGGYGGYGLGGW